MIYNVMISNKKYGKMITKIKLTHSLPHLVTLWDGMS